MAEICVTLTANAGVCIEIGKHCIWVDALHQEMQPGFSAVSQKVYQQLLNDPTFAEPAYICATHCHPDHYSGAMVGEAKRLWKNTQLCLPEQEFADQILISGETFVVKKDNLTLEFIRLPHEGAQYAGVKHYGILLSIDGKNILIAGDCETASPILAKAVGDRQIDLAILNFPWVTLSKGRAFVTEALKPKHILLCHLPFAEDDVGGFRASARRNARLLENVDVRLLSEPLQREIINI